MSSMESENSDELKKSNTIICCCSKSNIEQANRRVCLKTVFTDVNDDELGERLRKRFEEIYSSAIHENVSINQKTWSEVAEEDNSTIDFDPVDSSLKEKMDEKIVELDDLIVETSGKRKMIPPQTARQLAKLMKAKRKSSVFSMQAPDNKPSLTQRLPLDEKELVRHREKLEASCKGFESSSKSLPAMEDKVSRLKDALSLSNSMASSYTYRVLQKPLPDEALLATSLTPLKKRLEETPESRTTKNPEVAEKVRRGHPINRYHLRSATPSKD
ncbi:uncharacterized protein [Apostichopus japonicus]|uniref:uncharacterized protein n=1 Tax=Stichopus japonicus TaxID=307972 RepID=UPI003AB22C47